MERNYVYAIHYWELLVREARDRLHKSKHEGLLEIIRERSQELASKE